MKNNKDMKNTKKEYVTPEIDIVVFSEEDIITTSTLDAMDNFGDLDELI